MIRAYSSWKSKIQYLKILEYLLLSFIKWPCLQYIFLVSIETTIMEKTTDLAMIQKDDHWHPPQRGHRSHRGSLLKGVAVHRVLYQSILNAKLTGRKNLGRKRCTSNRDDHKLENTVKQADSNTCESFTRIGLKLESVHQESPHSDVFRKRATKPLLKQKQCQKHLTWATEKKNWTVAQWSKSSFQMKVNFAFHLEIKVPESGGRVERHWPWFADHDITVLDRPANMPDLNPIWNLWDIFKRKMRNSRSNNTDELKAAIKATWASITLQQCHKLITSMPRRIEAVIRAKGAPTKYWVHN